MNRPAQIFLPLLVLALGLGFFRAFAQEPSPVPQGVLKNYFQPFYRPYPKQNQLHQVIRAGEAMPQGNTNIILKDVTVETYDDDGKLEMTVHAISCVWDIHTETATSPGRIEARSADGKTFLEGEGFTWDNRDALFFVSNRVHTVVSSFTEKRTKP